MVGYPLSRRVKTLLTVFSLAITLNVVFVTTAECSWDPGSLFRMAANARQKHTLQMKSCRLGVLCYSRTTSGHNFIDTSGAVHLFQSFDYRISDPSAVAQYFDFVWGGSPRNVARFHEGHPNIVVSYYIPFHRDGGTYKNSKLYQSFSYWRTNHPDWILYKCDRKTPAYEFGDRNMPLDFSNPEVVQWQIQTYGLPASKDGYDAIAADNINMENLFGGCGSYHNHHWVQRYTGKMHDDQWHADVISWVARMQAGLHRLPHKLALIPNFSLGAKMTMEDPLVQQFLSHVDAVLDERGFTNYGQGYVTGERWVEAVRFIQLVQGRQKAIYILNQTKTAARQNQVLYALASYLMAKGRLASMYVTGSQDYGRIMLTGGYGVQVGNPAGNMYLSQDVYWRNYSDGLVVVNPSDTTSYTVQVSGNYLDIYHRRVERRFTLAPHSGKILIDG